MEKTLSASSGSLSDTGLSRDRLTEPVGRDGHGFLTFYPGASLAVVSAPTDDAYAQFEPKSKRGLITSFSDKSRNRLIRKLSTIHRRSEARAITLTFENNETDEQSAKSALHAFFERLRVDYRTIGCIWKLEYQTRGACHFHLLTWGGWIDKDWISSTWDRIARQNLTRGVSPSTKIEYVGSLHNSGRYLSKYVCKGGFQPGGENCGRIWGTHRKRFIPFVEPVTVGIDAERSRRILDEWSDRFGIPYRLNTVHIYLTTAQAEELESIMRHAP